MDFLVAAVVGMVPAAIARWVVIKRPVKMWHAIGLCAVLFVVNIMVLVALRREGLMSSYNGFVPGLFAFAGYILLRWGASKTTQDTESS